MTGALSVEEIASQAAAKALAAAGVPDPRKTTPGPPGGGGGGKGPKGKGKKKTQPPRDSEGRALKWVEGMDPCKHCNGSHLHRDCPNQEKEKGTAPAGAAAVAEQTSLHIKDVQGLTGAQLHEQLTQFFDEAEPCRDCECDASLVAEKSGNGSGLLSYFKSIFTYLCFPLLLLVGRDVAMNPTWHFCQVRHIPGRAANQLKTSLRSSPSTPSSFESSKRG